MSNLRVALALMLLGGPLAAAAAQNAPSPPQQPPPPQQHIKIAFVQIDGDPRYEPVRGYTRTILKTPEHPYAGAEIGVDEAAPLTRLLNADFTLDRISVKSLAEVAPAVLAAAEVGTHFFLIDAPAEAYAPLAS